MRQIVTVATAAEGADSLRLRLLPAPPHAMIQSDTARFSKHVRILRGWTSCAQLSYGLLGELMK